MNKYLEACREGLAIWQAPWPSTDLLTRQAVKLSFFNTFTAKEIAQITGLSKQAVTQAVYREINKRQAAQEARLKADPNSNSGWYRQDWKLHDFLVDRRTDLFNPATLDGLFILAEQRSATGRKRLIETIVANGTSLYTIASVTGIPLEDLREVLNDGDYSSVFGTESNPESGGSSS